MPTRPGDAAGWSGTGQESGNKVAAAMAGEDCNPVRNRRSGTSSSAYGASEKDEMQRRTEGERSSQTSSNGRVDVDHVITRKMQLIAEAEQLKPAFMKEVDSHFTEFVDSLIEKGLRAPPEHGKIFTARRSLLDELFELSHIRTIYHMFIALLIIFILSTVVVDFIDEGRLVLDFDLLVFAFVIGLGIGPVYVAVAYALPPASGFIVMLEQVRLIMKGHSFIRENVPRVLSSVKEKSSTVPVPRITQYLYFLFAPTLIYRDSYPRTPRIRWSYVATKFAQVLGSLFYSYYIFVRLCIPQFRNISQEPFNLRALVLCIFNSILPGILMYFLIFFAFLHCWLNAFAEMLRFADRMFYQDWWNSTSYANYYRTWNVVVHDWLYYYAYRDILWLFGKKFKAAAMLSVFAISAAVHEYVLAVCFGYFYPVLFCLFMCFGMVFNFILNDRRKGPFWNVIMWTSLFLGQGVIICLYSQEWYAHQYCPIKNPTFLDYMKPRSWTCRHVQI
ncbi:sterol O-acyltransferase 1 [Alligator mississippiensis]|uniref:Sterol O-acyltransferase 1 n=1 Tax=Alligator mississippiensis TaxID=8496 RepID=A0A151MII4_ALLMI|nr:sterol O-acyltransferase 1 [Alligator mississippiensis]